MWYFFSLAADALMRLNDECTCREQVQKSEQLTFLSKHKENSTCGVKYKLLLPICTIDYRFIIVTNFSIRGDSISFIVFMYTHGEAKM